MLILAFQSLTPFLSNFPRLGFSVFSRNIRDETRCSWDNEGNHQYPYEL